MARAIDPSRAHGNDVPALLCGDLNMLRCFVGRGIRTAVISSDPREVTLRSRHCEKALLIAPPEQNERCVADLERIAMSAGGRPVLYYGTDSMLLLVSRHRHRLGPLFRFRMPASELIEQLVDKIRFAELAARLGLPVPETAVSSEAPTAEAIAERVPFPCVVKPSVHIGWLHARARSRRRAQKAIRADSLKELREIVAEVSEHTDRFVVQRFVPGGEDRIYSYHAYADAQGRVLGCFAGKKIRTYPREAGVSTFLELIDEPELLRLGREIVERLELVGPVKIDFKRDAATGTFYVLELNPRFTLWNYLGAVCGVNLPLLAYADLLGEPTVFAGRYRTGVRWLSFGNDFRAFVRDYLPAGELSVIDYVKSFRGARVYDVFAWDDPLPLAAALLRYSKAAAQKLLPSPRASRPCVMQ